MLSFFIARYIRVFLEIQGTHMTDADIKQMENEVFTKLVIDLLKQQKAEGKMEFLLDRYEVDKVTKERLVQLLKENAKDSWFNFYLPYETVNTYIVFVESAS